MHVPKLFRVRRERDRALIQFLRRNGRRSRRKTMTTRIMIVDDDVVCRVLGAKQLFTTKTLGKYFFIKNADLFT
ncbi:MAG: hypothetical protein ACE5FU_08230 [Nitrospinota bacterium]